MVLGGALGPGLGGRDACGAAPLCVAGVALGDIHLRFTWQAWHKLTSTVVLRGRRGTYGTGWRPWARFRRAWRPWRRFTSAWQAWHNLTSMIVLRGRRGTYGTGCRPGPGLGGRDACGAASLLRGRRGTILHPRSFCVAGVAQTHIYRRFAWQAWDRWHWVARLDWLGRALVARDAAAWSTVVLRGRRGTYGTGWRPWARFRRAWRLWRRATLRGRRGINSHLPSFCVAGVALMLLGGALGPGLGGRDACGAAPLCVAGVALGDIHLRFTWQAWHKLTSTVVLRGRRGTYGTGWRPWARFRRAWRPWRRFTSAWQAWHNLTSMIVLRGRRGTYGTGCRPGPGLGGRDACGAASLLRGRRGTILHPRSFCVAGVAQTHIYRRFAWQAWHLWYWVAPLGPV